MYSNNNFSQADNNQIVFHITALNGWAPGSYISNERILDISTGGLKASVLLSRPGRLKKSSQLDIFITALIEDRMQVLNAVTHLVWTREEPELEDYTYTIGLRFIAPSQEFKARLEHIMSTKQQTPDENRSNMFRRKSKRITIN